MHEQKQFEVLAWASSYLNKYNRETHIAELLLQHHLDVSRATFFGEMQEIVPGEVVARFKHDIKKHALFGVPAQHLIGSAPFYGRTFKVTGDVLVPRFETEELVHHVIKEVKRYEQEDAITIVDIGTGSGVIAITLALELPHVKVIATDISSEALAIARENAASHQANISFYEGDFLQPVLDRNLSPQIIVSNPPYIKLTDDKMLADTVEKYDPHLALFGGEDGLAAYRKILQQTTVLPERQDRKLYVEIGFDQAAEVTDLIQATYPKSDVVTIKDINQLDRIISTTLTK